METFDATMQRYALAWEIGVEEAMTEEGQTIAVGHMINVALSFVELMEQLILMSLLDAKMHWRVKMRREHAPYSSPARWPARRRCLRRHAPRR